MAQNVASSPSKLSKGLAVSEVILNGNRPEGLISERRRRRMLLERRAHFIYINLTGNETENVFISAIFESTDSRSVREAYEANKATHVTVAGGKSSTTLHRGLYSLRWSAKWCGHT
jgi:hypothetical protein